MAQKATDLHRQIGTAPCCKKKNKICVLLWSSVHLCAIENICYQIDNSSST